MSYRESTQERRKRSTAVTTVLILCAPILTVAFHVLDVDRRVSTYTGEAALLSWCLLNLLVSFWLTRGGIRIAVSLGVIVVLPFLLFRMYSGYGVTLGMTTSIEATVITCAGCALLTSLGLTGRGLPLVLKELLEQSARRRTYILRIVYASLAFLAGFSFSFQILHQNWGNPYAILGKGQELFGMFVGLQFFGIYLFMPAMCCNLITSEKERDTLSLLFLTRLSPWGILVGKFLSRLLSMFFFMALTLPLFGFAYSMGGFEMSYLWSAVWVLFVTMVQVGSLALLCSCWFRRTVGAFIGTYVFGFLMLFAPLIFDEWTGLIRQAYRGILEMLGTQDVLGFHEYSFSGMFFAPMALFQGGPFGGNSFLPCVMRTIPSLVVTALFLLFSRIFIVRRATAQPRNLLLKIFRTLDRWFWGLNERFGKGIVLSRKTDQLPADRPIAWRETTHRTLGTTRYLVRIFILLEFPILFICALSVSSGRGGLEVMAAMLMMVWIIVAMLICGSSTSLISAEHSSQTFDTLLTTPMSNREILSQKFVGTRRLLVVLAVPLLTIYAFQVMLRFDVPDLGSRRRGLHQMDPDSLTWSYALTGLATVVIYLPMISWLAFWFGLKIRSQGKAIIASVAALVAWCLIPLLILFPFIVMFDLNNPGEWEMLMIVSPMMVVPLNEFGEFNDPWVALAINSGVYGAIMLALRFTCLLRSVRLLGRADSVTTGSPGVAGQAAT